MSKTLLYARETGAFVNGWYSDNFDRWEAARIAYEGGQDFISANLVKHEDETTKSFDRRNAIAVYENHTRMVVDTYTSQLFKRSIARQKMQGAAGELLDGFFENVTRSGVSADEFFETFTQRLINYGACAIMVDRFDSVNAQTRAQELGGNARPYAYIVEPQNLVNWVLDEDNQFEAVLIREVFTPKTSVLEAPGIPVYRYRAWFRDRWELYDIVAGEAEGEFTFKKTAEGLHNLGQVPIVVSYFQKAVSDGVPVGPSLVDDVAAISKRAFNLRSLIDEQIWQQCFNLLVVGEKLFDRINGFKFGVSGVLAQYEGEPPPFYLSPKMEVIDNLASQLKECQQEIRVLSGLGRLSEGASAESGIALAYKNVDKAALYQRLAQTIQDAEIRVTRLALKWFEIEDEPTAPKYEVQLEPGQIDDELNRANRFSVLAGMTAEPLKENVKQAVISRFSGQVSEEKLAELLADIDTNFSVPIAPDSLL